MRTARLIAWSLACWMLASCGGGSTLAEGTSGGVGTGGTGISLGTVTGFGSVVIDGTPYNSASPQYFAPSQLSETAPASSSDVALGSQVQVELDAQGSPSSVTVAPELVGAVASPDATGFSVNGVRVQVNKLTASGPVTYFSGLSGPAALRAGMQVAVSGVCGGDANATPFVQATLVERLPDANPIVRISGLVSSLNAAGKTFRLGGITVDYSNATQAAPTSATLANGLWVSVWANQPLGNGGTTLAATTLRIRSLVGRSGSVQISGLISNLSGSAFQISAIPVNASAASLATKLAGLRSGDYVTVQGQVDAASGAITASTIASYVSAPVQTALQGNITGYVGASAFFVRGVPVDASSAQFLNGASAAALADGVYVELTGTVGATHADVVVVSSLAVVAQPANGKTVIYRGTVSQFNAAAKTFALSRMDPGASQPETITLGANLAYSNGNAQALVNGANVEVETTKTATGLSAYSIRFIAAAPMGNGGGGNRQATLVRGRVDNLTASDMSVGGLAIQLNGVSAQNGVLANGVQVDVWLNAAAGSNLAQSIHVMN